MPLQGHRAQGLTTKAGSNAQEPASRRSRSRSIGTRRIVTHRRRTHLDGPPPAYAVTAPRAPRTIPYFAAPASRNCAIDWRGRVSSAWHVPQTLTSTSVMRMRVRGMKIDRRAYVAVTRSPQCGQCTDVVSPAFQGASMVRPPRCGAEISCLALPSPAVILPPSPPPPPHPSPHHLRHSRRLDGWERHPDCVRIRLCS